MTKRTDGPSSAVKIRVMKRDRFRCTYCGAPGTDAELEVDHIIPVARGGSHHISNLTTACRKCNQSKGARDAPPRAVAEPSTVIQHPRGPGVSITEVMICWTPKVDYFADEKRYGQIALVPWPDTKGRSDGWSQTTGACDLKIHKWTAFQRQYFVMSTALGIILDDGIPATDVHKALWPLIEYRASLPPDTSAPPTNHRYGDIANPMYEGL